ncbi:MAG: T9SS type A sorting domain-containing protein, partial [Bacteroidales bacterium]|nr:T9SS type A sorting domain-containing protein [Bacteroidales bacterium]
YAWFDNGESLNKIIHRNSEVPMLYIPQNDGNYSIAYMSDNTEMFNLNFKAMTAGKYTLSVSEKGDFSYLHVYDRLTGEDVDMLLDSYTFIGSPVDNEARFIVRLSYNASTTGSETFAFQNGSDVIVNGNGELQVFDLTGRMVMNTTVNGIQAVSMPQGVYVLRMIGENVQTQKIVVR